MSVPRNTSTDYQRPHRPRAVALINRLGLVLDRLPVSYADLDADSLVTAARRRTGLRDLGDDTLIDRLRRLTVSLQDEARLHPLGRLMVRENLLRILKNRLRIQADLVRQPQILDQEVTSPVIITGLQRTGTTVLHRLLASDPRFRFLPSWEAVNPAPFPGERNGRPAARIRAARLAEKALVFLAPDFFAIHPVQHESPEEDCLLKDFALWSTVPEATQRVPAFARWLEAQDHSDSYLFFRQILRYLQWRRPAGRWVLKTPEHLEYLDALLAVLPDARIIQTHRDPTVTMASFCSMMAHARGVFSDHVDPHEVGRFWLRKASRMIDRSMAVRARHPSASATFLDVQYADLTRDPLATVERVYRFIGEELTPAARVQMQAFLAENPQHRFGRHRYRLTDFGLAKDQVDRAFAEYRKRYGIPREERRDP